ncbi:MAG: tetratricopeptide repeat protein [Phycisphaerales bacterium]
MDETPTSPTGADQPTRDASPSAPRLDAQRHVGGNVPQRGEQIGPYTLLELIGEGGFGTVWLAERREPMVQRVAIKIIKPGMDSKAVVARFDQERQALAVMDHPNVAKVFDGGVTERGLPYFVMEYVAGKPITSFCDEHRCTIRQRLELFASVCDAVQHAHMKGIIHRDLKPSNLLAEMVDGKPLVMVIDFGIAKALVQDASVAQFTSEGVAIGTTEYMSPEQAGGRLDVDTRTDVYALGVVLYELLVGRLPFDPAALRQLGFDEVRRIIREEDPPRPSTRLSTIGVEGNAIALSRSHHSPAALVRELRRELEWIPLKAMRKERDRRYESAAALGEDVRRYLDGRALQAAPESRMYLARKLVARNKPQVIAAAAVFVALGAGLAVSLWQRSEAIAARDAEAKERALAEQQSARADDRAIAAEKAEKAEKQRADQLKKLSDFQAQMLGQIDTTKAGADLMSDVCERFVAALERSGVPESERTAQMNALRQDLGRVNATDAAVAMIDRTILKPAIRTIDAHFKDDPATDASLRQALADRYRTLGLDDDAFPLQESALATRRRVLGEEHPDTLASIHSMGVLLQSHGKLSEAEPYAREALEKRRRVLGEEHPDTLASINSMGFLLQSQARLSEAEPYLREVLDKSRRVLGEEHQSTLNALNSMGWLLQSQGKLTEAEPYYREAMEKSRRVLGEDHPDTLNAINSMGWLLQCQGRLSEAEPYSRTALEKRRRVLGEEHPGTLASINSMGYLLQSQGKLAEAEPYYREALEKYRRVLGEDHPGTLNSINSIGFLLQSQGKLDEAEPYYRTALEKRRRVLGEDHPDTLILVYWMARLKLDQHKDQEALELIASFEPAARRTFTGENAWRFADFLTILGRARVRVGHEARQFSQAESNLLEAHSIYLAAKDRGPTHKDTLECVQAVVDLYVAWDKAEPGKGYDAKAAEWKAKASRSDSDPR